MFIVWAISAAIYFGMYFENEGLSNILVTALWVLVLLLIIGLFGKDKTYSKSNVPRFIKYAYRTHWVLNILAMIYAGYIVLGIMYTIVILLLILSNGDSDV